MEAREDATRTGVQFEGLVDGHLGCKTLFAHIAFIIRQFWARALSLKMPAAGRGLQ
jgi:hypothetical protein